MLDSGRDDVPAILEVMGLTISIILATHDQAMIKLPLNEDFTLLHCIGWNIESNSLPEQSSLMGLMSATGENRLMVPVLQKTTGCYERFGTVNIRRKRGKQRGHRIVYRDGSEEADMKDIISRY